MQGFFKKQSGKWKVAGVVLRAACGLAYGLSAPAQSDQMASTTVIANTANNGHSASKTVLVLGDSLSAEYGLARGTGWVPLLEHRLQSRRIDAAVINASISGDTTSGGRSRLQPLLDRQRPGIVVLELGGNDALRGLPVSATQANLLDMINASQKAGARVVLLGMQIPPNYGGDYARQFAGIYPKLAKQTGAVLVPFFLEGLQTRTDLFQADRIHPVAGAQPMLLENVWPYLDPLLGAETGSTRIRSGAVRGTAAVTSP